MLHANHSFSRSCDCHVIGLVCREVLKQLCKEGVSTGILEERRSQFAHQLEEMRANSEVGQVTVM